MAVPGSCGAEQFAIGKLWDLGFAEARRQGCRILGGTVLCRRSAVLAVNEGPQEDNQTVALSCVTRLKGDLGPSRYWKERGEAGQGAKVPC